MPVLHRVQILRPPHWASVVGSGAILSVLVVAAASLAGALVFPLSSFGRASLGSVSKDWLLLLLGFWAILVAWAFLYALLLRRLLGLSAERSLYWAAICHSPLLLSLGLASTLYGGDLANHVYSNTAYGRVIFQPLAQWIVVAVPAVAQSLLLAARRPRLVGRALPLAAVTLGALALRLWNLNWSLPALYHPDEHHYIGLALRMMQTGDLNPHYFQNPSLLIYVDTLLARTLSQQAQPFHVINDFFALGAVDLRGDYLVDLGTRAVSALAGAMTVPMIYLGARKLYGNRAALFSACLLAVAFLHVRDSHYATNDVLATFFLAVSFYYAVRIATEGHLSDYLLAGLFGGLGTGTKYNVGLFAAGILVAHLMRCRHVSEVARAGKTPRLSLLRRHLPLIASGLISAAAFLATTPYALLDFSYFSADFRTQYGFGAEPWPAQDPGPPALLYFNILARGFGVVPLGLAVLGAILAARSDWRRFALLASVPAAYLLFMSNQQMVFARFAIPLLPFAAVFAGHAIDNLAFGNDRADPEMVEVPASGTRYGQLKSILRREWSARRRILTASLVLAAALAQPVAFSVWQDNLLGMDDTRSLVAQWVEENLSPASTMAVEGWAWMAYPFQWRGGQPRSTSTFWATEATDTAEVLRGDYDYAVVSSFGYWSWQRAMDPASDRAPFYRELDMKGKLVAVFEPGIGNTEVPYNPDEVCGPFWHLTDRERPGPSIRIYRMEREQP